jgi:hypothetical protein
MQIDTITNKIYTELLEIIVDKKLQVDDAMTLVAYSVKLINKVKEADNNKKTEILMIVFERIAKGKDGQVGTADDVIPEKVWNQVQILLKEGIMFSMISVIDDIVNGKFPEIDEVAKTAKGCASFFSRICGKKHQN